MVVFIHMYKLSPSDFKYLWEDCKYCFYQKVKNEIKLPATPFPGIFGTLNNMLQNSIVGMNMQTINSNLPDAVVDVKEGYLKSITIPGTNCYISGRFDILSQTKDGAYTLIDFKIMEADEEKMLKYSLQLHAYKYALENPAPRGKLVAVPRTISHMGIVVISPQSMELSAGNVIFTSKPKYLEIEQNMDEFYEFVREISALLDGPIPLRSPNCTYCSYRTTKHPE